MQMSWPLMLGDIHSKQDLILVPPTSLSLSSLLNVRVIELLQE